ncbi:hypothetical protein COCSUDRAFT_56599 [Coccomyxa subellipsoidea C-169]|uniref:Uncharacterized protein n=1 Tax=Coccomyxa subellipsoidea (strain C-169) TaxID=574566 RepID=I0YSL1_COCSC|nr:hypothetical protein COCSUDRAFT_56599 [Coccomyxa subellipsoidea C-169]EIE21380.1 hypothetical protein COCSUDRAFT_56599 [Coccomyxa subellipsoidea C-169]|eukprot:XP_005645924.1 hypothetical protein COCSUDRAFT_56599 [Coccomyxa subellipsoidea C-169]
MSSGSSAGDPIMTDFEGHTFEFMGEVGKFYDVISEKDHQMTMKLKLGQMWDHNGTYMEGIGFRYQDHTVVIELASDDSMHVSLDGTQLEMAEDENEQEHILGLESGEMMLLWQLHCPGMGQAVEITTDLLWIVIYFTPAGTRDEGGVIQPAYINFDAALLEAPMHELKGVIGEGYGRLASPTKPSLPRDDFKFHGDERDYILDSYFPAVTHKVARAFSRGYSAYGGNRKLIESNDVEFPLSFRSGRSLRA